MGTGRRMFRHNDAAIPGPMESGREWWDIHFESARPEYEAMIRSVGLRPGWHVLDAGCGWGSFFPTIAEAVGPTGRITALDLSQKSIAYLDEAVPGWLLDCPVATRLGTMTALPYPDATFDAVWSANAVQNLTDAELAIALREFRRVVRPGGIVAVKEGDMTRTSVVPDEPARMWRLLDALQPAVLQIHGMMRVLVLRRWFIEAGFEEVWQRGTLVERWAPLRAVERRFIGEVFGWITGMATKVALSEDDHAFWRTLRDPEDPDHPLNRPDFHYFEAHSLVVGRVPLR